MNGAASSVSRFFDWEAGRITLLGVVGNVSANFDFFASKTITILTLVLLLHKAWRVINRRRKQKDQEEE